MEGTLIAKFYSDDEITKEDSQSIIEFLKSIEVETLTFDVNYLRLIPPPYVGYFIIFLNETVVGIIEKNLEQLIEHCNSLAIKLEEPVITYPSVISAPDKKPE